MTQNDHRDELSPEIVLSLAAGGVEPAGTHPDDPTLTAYLEGLLGSGRRNAVETHLAACADCRELAAIAAEAAEDSARAVLPSRRARFWPLPSRRLRLAWVAAGLAALLALVPAYLVLRGPRGVDLAALGVERAERAAAGPDLAARAKRLASGELSAVPGLEGLELAAPGIARREDPNERPEALLPRWSAVLSARPRFDWMAPAGTGEQELLLVDGEERLVGSVALAAEARAASYPADFPALEPGALYAWRISARVGEAWRSSAFVPFRVLGPAEISVLNRDLEAAGNDPLLRAAAYLTAGVDREGLAELAEVADQTGASDEVAKMVQAVLRRQTLSTELAVVRGPRLIEAPPDR